MPARSRPRSPPPLLLPLLRPLARRLSPERFALVRQANPEAMLDLAADGQLIAMTISRGIP